MRALNAVIDEGSFAAAAKQLGLSQPAISQAIGELERAYEVQLFERRGRHLIPTALCLELAPLAGEMRRLEEAATSVLQKRGRLQSGLLRIAIGSLNPGMRLVSQFQRHFPGIQVQLEYGMFSEVMRQVLEREVEIGILPRVPDDKRFVRKLCLKQDIVALVPLGHPLAGAGSVSLEQLAKERLIFQQRGSATQRIVDAAFAKAGLHPTPSLVLRVHTEVYEAVTTGLGIGFIWRYGTSRKDAARRIDIREIDTVFEEHVFRRADTQGPVVEMFFNSVEMP
jgi:DNA-binding transcriptional LysR family regulator